MPLEKVLRIENIGRFAKLLPAGDVQFRRLNLLFAQNGHGKTTLAGVLRSAKTGDPAFVRERARIGGTDPRVEVRLAGANLTFTNGKWNATAAEIEIFDSTFVSDNVYAGDNVDPAQRKNLYDVIVGAPAVALARQVDEIDSMSRGTAAAITAAEKKLWGFVQAPFDLSVFVCPQNLEDPLWNLRQ